MKAVEEAILKSIKLQEITDQQKLINMLSRMSISIPQATLSRKLKKLNITKINGIYKQLKPYPLLISRLEMSPPNLIVIHTTPGNANSLAAQIDHKNIQPFIKSYNGLLGTIAGDDTVLVIVKSKKFLNSIANQLKSDFS